MPGSIKWIVGTVFAGSLAAGVSAHAASDKVVYSFTGGSDGAIPSAGLINVGGTLYGTTAHGGSANCYHGCGTVFSVTPSGTETIVYAFNGGTDGNYPSAGLINVGGILYGTTSQGGGSANCAKGCGTVFAVTPVGAEKVVYAFNGGTDGSSPAAGLINVSGTLYGTTYYGGASNAGTVFSVTPAGAEKVVYAFKGLSDGANPAAGLVKLGGTLYGTTQWGGSATCSYECGTVFSVTPSGAEKVVYAFNRSDGANPYAGLINVGGTLYGTTTGGGSQCDCGTVFSVTPAGALSVVYSFQGGRDGFQPIGGLIKMGGAFYGTTYAGGSTACKPHDTRCGTVFKVTTAGAEQVLYRFKGAIDGQRSGAGLTNLGGLLYGTTFAGGGSANCPDIYGGGCGTVFAITP